MQDLTKVTRLELIDHTPCKRCNGEPYGELISQTCPDCGGSGMPGRTVLFWDAYKKVELSLQDGGRTLKIFVSNRDEEPN